MQNYTPKMYMCSLCIIIFRECMCSWTATDPNQLWPPQKRWVEQTGHSWWPSDPEAACQRLPCSRSHDQRTTSMCQSNSAWTEWRLLLTRLWNIECRSFTDVDIKPIFKVSHIFQNDQWPATQTTKLLDKKQESKHSWKLYVRYYTTTCSYKYNWKKHILKSLPKSQN